MNWYRKAAEQGDARAQINIGIMYTSGQGVKQDYAEATAWYEKASARSRQVLAQQPGDSQAKTDLHDALTSLSWQYLFAQQFDKAKAAAEEGYALDNSSILVLGNLAHAEMFLGHSEAAQALYQKYMGQKIDDTRTWEGGVLEDFAEFRKVGLNNPLMPAIEKLLGRQ